MNNTPRPETQATTPSTIQPYGVSQICKPVVLGIGIVAFAAITVACSPEPQKWVDTPPPPCPQCESKPLSKSVEDELNRPILVFAIDAAGKIQAFRGSDANAFKPEFPREVTLLAHESVSYVVLNPKICWKTTAGNQECATY